MAEFSKDDFLSGMSAAKVDNVEVEAVAEPVKIDIVNDEPEPKVDLDEYDETHLIKEFATGVGYDGEIEGSGLDAIIGIAKKQTEKYKEIAEDPRVQDYLNFINDGGTREQFVQSQPSNVYGSVVLDEEDTDLTERVVQEVLIVLRNYDDQDEVNDFVNDLKDKGKLFEFAEKNLPKLKDKETTDNKVRKAQVDAEVAQQQREANAYFKTIDDSFKGNKLIGIAPDSNFEEVRKLSVPDEKGRIGIDAILDNLEPDQVATMNYFAYCMTKNLPFTFKPTGKEGTKAKPILAILDKGKSEVATPQGVGALGKALNSKLRNN